MKITVIRKELSKVATIGELYVDGAFECYTLEDTVRSLLTAKDKVYGQTAIPAGVYDVTLTHSPRFKRTLPLLNNVPFFEGVRIHPGNTAADTDGCILVGTTKIAPINGPTVMIGNSRAAFDKLYAKMEKAGKIVLTITEMSRAAS